MTIAEKIILFTRNAFETLLYFTVMAVKENFRNYISKAGCGIHPKKALLILGNGPSLKEDLPKILQGKECEKKDVMAVNFFAMDVRFEQVRPAYYVLSDPMFFRESIYREKVMSFYEQLNEKVQWSMRLYVQYYNPEKFDYRKVITNPKIRIVPFHTLMYSGFRRVQFWLFRHGLGSANFGTVVQNGVYIALLLGYKTVELYGVDHTLLDGLCVDEKNRLCRRVSHYYDATPQEPKPIFQNVPHRPYTMALYMKEMAQLFEGHEVLRDYASSLGAHIINRTRGSMIDAYKRQPLEESSK